MIKRDNYSIVVQHDPNDNSYMDGGDSSNRTGLLAMCGNKQDQDLLHLFEYGHFSGLLRRHPYTDDYSNPWSFTRDQLLPFMAGCRKADEICLARRVFWSHFSRGFLCQNKLGIHLEPKKWWDRDILAPHHIGHLILCAKMWIFYPFLLFSWVWMFLDLLWSTKVAPDSESNQLISILDIAGKYWLYLYCKLHPDWKKPIREYWGFEIINGEGSNIFRYQPEIANMLISYIEGRIK